MSLIPLDSCDKCGAEGSIWERPDDDPSVGYYGTDFVCEYCGARGQCYLARPEGKQAEREE